MCECCCNCLKRLWRLLGCIDDEKNERVEPAVVYINDDHDTPLGASQPVTNGEINAGLETDDDAPRFTDPNDIQPELPETPATSTEVENIYIALCYFQARVDKDLSFAKSERLAIISMLDGDWWYARSLKTNKEGYIPSNYVAPEGSFDAIEWYYGDISRIEAENRLKTGILPNGTFLVRKAQTGPATYSLSIRKDDSVLHYKILKLENGCYTINTKSVFPTLDELISHHKDDADGLACPLTKPCTEMSITAPSLSKDAWEIDRTSLELKTKLGAGQFAEVWLGVWKEQTNVAVKKLKEGAMTREDFLEEATIMKKLRHKYLVQLFAICSDHEPILIITEYMMHGSLLDYLKKSLKGEVHLTLRHLIDMMAQIAAGMAYLESQDYVHRDLAARNILVGENNTCKVADFGLARFLHDGYYRANESAKLPIKWLAIESAQRRIFTIKSDVWAFGILMYEIITRGKVPYPGMSNVEVVAQLERGYRMDQPQGCPLQIYAVMAQCWEDNETMRPSFKNLQEKFQRLCSYEKLEERLVAE